MRLIGSENNFKRVTKKISNFYNIACVKLKLLCGITAGCLLKMHPLVSQKQCKFDQMNEICIQQNMVVD